jgi:hypothetical protein
MDKPDTLVSMHYFGSDYYRATNDSHQPSEKKLFLFGQSRKKFEGLLV